MNKDKTILLTVCGMYGRNDIDSLYSICLEKAMNEVEKHNAQQN